MMACQSVITLPRHALPCLASPVHIEHSLHSAIQLSLHTGDLTRHRLLLLLLLPPYSDWVLFTISALAVTRDYVVRERLRKNKR